MEVNFGNILSIITLIGVVIAVYRSFSDPNKRQDRQIAVGEATCKLKHEDLNKDISKINNTLLLIENNSLKHIEERMNTIENKQVKIFTILEERLPNK